MIGQGVDTAVQEDLAAFREKIQREYATCPQKYWRGDEFRSGDFGEILCFEIHSVKCQARAPQGGVTFKELAKKWGITVSFLGELIADHCRKLEEATVPTGGRHEP